MGIRAFSELKRASIASRRRGGVRPGSRLILAIIAVVALWLGLIGAPPEAAPFPSGRIVFTSDRGGTWQHYVMNADGSRLRRLTNLPGDNAPGDTMEPAFSPDGHKVAFVSTRMAPKKALPTVFVMNDDGSNLRAITPAWLGGRHPTFSRDSRRIAFTGFTAASVPQKQLYVANVDGSGRASTVQLGDCPSFEPDGSIFFLGDDGFFRATRADGTGVRTLTAPDAIYIGCPRLSLDGRTVAYVRSPRQNANAADFNLEQIYLWTTDTWNGRYLTHLPRQNLYPTLSFDGQWVAFASRQYHSPVLPSTNPWKPFELFVVNVTGKDLHRLTTPPSENSEPVLGP